MALLPLFAESAQTLPCLDLRGLPEEAERGKVASTPYSRRPTISAPRASFSVLCSAERWPPNTRVTLGTERWGSSWAGFRQCLTGQSETLVL